MLKGSLERAVLEELVLKSVEEILKVNIFESLLVRGGLVGCS